jgi:NADPH2:quinone reductase
MADANIPETMKAVVVREAIKKYDASIREVITVDDVPVPKPRAGQVLVRVEFSTVNPSDTSYLKGQYGREFAPPCGAGFEGTGTVVASGGGFMAWRVMGTRVSFYSDASWAEYVVIPAASAIQILDSTPFSNAAGALVNPLTVLSFVEIAKAGKHPCIVHTAGASSLGKMLIRQAKKNGIEVIAVVRRAEQAEACMAEGARAAFDSTADDFEADLKKECAAAGATVAFDAVCGPLAGQVFTAMPAGGILYVYGGLSGQPAEGLSVKDLIFSRKQCRGFWLTQYMKENKNIIGMIAWARAVAQGIDKELATPIARTVKLGDGADAICDGILSYVNNMSAGKVLIKCRIDDDDAAAEGEDVEEEEDAGKEAADDE